MLGAIGRTPLVELDLAALLAAAPGLPELPRDVASAAAGLVGRTRIVAKLESALPGGSIKDRPVAAMLVAAIEGGELDGERRLLDSSSGNAGIAYAMLGGALGVPVTLVVPGNASRERLDRIRAQGAELILTDPQLGYDHAVLEARRLAREQPELYFHCDQYGNPHNPRAHEQGTGGEILEQARARCGEDPDAFVAGVGTGGTLTGIGRRLRSARLGTRILAVVPDAFPGIEGLKPLGPGDLRPANLDESLIDARRTVTIEEACGLCRRLARQGLFVGPSSGANVLGALALAAAEPVRLVATVLSDGGERYVSTGMWEPARTA
ncbi:MAG TPA: pyridoxal-phosphate dependent enzyme [Planctomycetota bacterium]|nr:pyridoxal-phosphate dependent enzyme [Planctomycetota bacterium]